MKSSQQIKFILLAIVVATAITVFSISFGPATAAENNELCPVSPDHDGFGLGAEGINGGAPFDVADTGPVPLKGGSLTVGEEVIKIPGGCIGNCDGAHPGMGKDPPIHNTAESGAGTTQSMSSVSYVEVNAGGYQIIADWLMPSAMASLTPKGPQVTGNSSIGWIFIYDPSGSLIYSYTNTSELSETVRVPLNGGADGQITLNEITSFVTGQRARITANAIHVIVRGVADFVVASAEAGVNGNGAPEAIKVPLGGESAQQTMTQCFKVYVPDKRGGKLTITATGDGQIGEIRAPDNSVFNNGDDTKEKYGWYRFRVVGTNYKVSNTFVQEGEAKTVPWNFFYFPFLTSDTRPKLYDVPGAYTKFDTKFGLGTASFDWETTNPNPRHRSDTAVGWAGHCWGSTLASIILEQPEAAKGFTQDELEGLAADFFDRFGATKLFKELPVKQAEAGADDTDKYAHEFHNGVAEMLRDKKTAFHADLRQKSGTGAEQVWNQGCFTYRAELQEDPAAAGNPETEKILQIKIKNTFKCNDDFVKDRVSLGNPKANPDYRREQESTYILMYGKNGTVMPNGEIAGRKQNWLTMKLKHYVADTGVPTDVDRDVYVPWGGMNVTSTAAYFKNEATPVGRNPHVQGKRLWDLGLRKNNGF